MIENNQNTEKWRCVENDHLNITKGGQPDKCCCQQCNCKQFTKIPTGTMITKER